MWARGLLAILLLLLLLGALLALLRTTLLTTHAAFLLGLAGPFVLVAHLAAALLTLLVLAALLLVSALAGLLLLLLLSRLGLATLLATLALLLSHCCLQVARRGVPHGGLSNARATAGGRRQCGAYGICGMQT